MKRALSFVLLAVAHHAAIGTAAASSPDPIIHYTFDDGLDPTADLGLLGCPGSVGGGIVFIDYGDGKVLQFDPTDVWVTPMCSEDSFDIGDGDFTVMATIHTVTSEDGFESLRFIITKEQLGMDPGWLLGVRRGDGRVAFGVSDGAAEAKVVSDVSVNDGAAHQITGIRDGDRLFVLVDGVLCGESTVPVSFGSTEDNEDLLRIGGRGIGALTPDTGSNDEWSGIIDDVRLYDEATLDCDCAADWLRDCEINSNDLFEFLMDFSAGDADVDGDGSTTSLDFFEFLSVLSAGCS